MPGALQQDGLKIYSNINTIQNIPKGGTISPEGTVAELPHPVSECGSSNDTLPGDFTEDARGGQVEPDHRPAATGQGQFVPPRLG